MQLWSTASVTDRVLLSGWPTGAVNRLVRSQSSRETSVIKFHCMHCTLTIRSCLRLRYTTYSVESAPVHICKKVSVYTYIAGLIHNKALKVFKRSPSAFGQSKEHRLNATDNNDKNIRQSRRDVERHSKFAVSNISRDGRACHELTIATSVTCRFTYNLLEWDR